MTSEHGLGLDVSLDNATREAVARALPVLATEPVANLRGHRLDAEDFDRLSVGDPIRDLLSWMSDAEGFRQRCESGCWQTFCTVAAREFNIDCERGLTEAAQMLREGGGKWDAVWERFCEAPRIYRGISTLLREVGAPKKPSLFRPIVADQAWHRRTQRLRWLPDDVPSRGEWTIYDDEVRELQEYEVQRSIFSSHQTMWEEINQLRAGGKLEYRDSASCRRDCDDDTDDNDIEPPPFLDAMLLAHDLGCRLLADDRLCQAAVLNQRPDMSDAAFGTDRLLVGLEDKGGLSTDNVCADLIQMMRWRYRFLLPEPRHLKVAALRSPDSLPGPELREIAAYVQESMRDPGLFCGPEKADLPTPVAFKYFMAWKEVCVEFLGALWDDSSITSPQLEAVTRWCIESLLPSVPRGMLYSPVGRRLADFTPKAFMLTAMIRFATVLPVQRASEALRLMASQLGMTEDEFYEAAAEAADGRYD